MMTRTATTTTVDTTICISTNQDTLVIDCVRKILIDFEIQL